MTGIPELTRYVEAHPGETEQRWRLVKKLYHACEYDEALEHLLVIKREWPTKLNVLRYLAAAYYRLGRYEEAIEVLEHALSEWPHVMVLYEQLARVFEMAGRREESRLVWEKILAEDPYHPTAPQAIKRLQKDKQQTPPQQRVIDDSDSGIDIQEGNICPACGAHNGEELTRCWKCNSLLPTFKNPTPSPATKKGEEAGEPEEAAAPPSPFMRISLTAAGVGLTLILGVLAVAITTNNWERAFPYSGIPPIPLTVYGVLADNLAILRVLGGIVLLAAWPASLYIAGVLMTLTPRAGSAYLFAGLSLAFAAYSATWLPVEHLLYAPLALGLLAFLACLAIFRGPFVRILGAWAAQMILVTGAALVLVVSTEGVKPLVELPVISAYAARHDNQQTPGVYEVNPSLAPLQMGIVWQSTGSEWLDTWAHEAVIAISLEEPLEEPLRVVVRKDEQVVEHIELTEGQIAIPVRAEPSAEHRLSVTGPLDVRIQPRIYAVLRPRFVP
ncbi:MAG: tetratricopeptide repeat protein [Candidatus Hydrogenedentota bacterium]